MIQLVLLRHGRSAADDEKVHEGRYDSPLTETGFQQARKRLQDFQARGFGFDRIIASPLVRARAVAEVMREGLSAPLELDPDWMEMDNGKIAGLGFEEGLQRFPIPSFRGPFERPFDGSGESLWELYSRAARAVQGVVQRGSGWYLVVSHGGLLNAALAVMTGTVPAASNQGFRWAFADLGYTRLEYHPHKHRWVLLEHQMGFNTHE